LKRPAPAKEVSTASSGPKLREVHKAKNGMTMRWWQEHFNKE
jgi:hypothetical protein